MTTSSPKTLWTIARILSTGELVALPPFSKVSWGVTHASLGEAQADEKASAVNRWLEKSEDPLKTWVMHANCASADKGGFNEDAGYAILKFNRAFMVHIAAHVVALEQQLASIPVNKEFPGSQTLSISFEAPSHFARIERQQKIGEGVWTIVADRDDTTLSYSSTSFDLVSAAIPFKDLVARFEAQKPGEVCVHAQKGDMWLLHDALLDPSQYMEISNEEHELLRTALCEYLKPSGDVEEAGNDHQPSTTPT